MNVDAEPLLRPARRADAEALAPLVYRAGGAAFDYILDHGRRRAADFLGFALRDGGGLIGWRNHHVVEQAGRVVGCAAFYSGIEASALSAATLRQFFRFYPPWHALRVVHRAGLLGAMQPSPADDEWYVAHLSIDPAYRGRGLARSLLSYGLLLARANSKHCYVLDVAVDNVDAQQLYTRFGFREIARRGFPAPGAGIPASRRMACKIFAK